MIDRPRIVKTNDIAAYQLSVDALERWAELAEKENEELKKHTDPFWDEEPPKGLDPTFYRTLSYEGDMKIYNKIKALK